MDGLGKTHLHIEAAYLCDASEYAWREQFLDFAVARHRGGKPVFIFKADIVVEYVLYFQFDNVIFLVFLSDKFFYILSQVGAVIRAAFIQTVYIYGRFPLLLKLQLTDFVLVVLIFHDKFVTVFVNT